jgi:hypothetical protein
MRTTCCLQFQPLQLAAALLIIAGDELQLDTANWSQLLSSSNDDNNFTAVNNNDIADGASSSALVSDEIVRIVRALIEQVYSMPEIRHTLEGRFAARALIQHSSRSGDETGGHLRKRINSNKHSSSNSSSVQSPKRTRTNN